MYIYYIHALPDGSVLPNKEWWYIPEQYIREREVEVVGSVLGRVEVE